MAWLLDTNVLSELRKLKPEPRVVAFVSSLRLGQIYISSVTVAEIRFGIERVTDQARHTALSHWLTNEIRQPMTQSGVSGLIGDTLNAKPNLGHGHRTDINLSKTK